MKSKGRFIVLNDLNPKTGKALLTSIAPGYAVSGKLTQSFLYVRVVKVITPFVGPQQVPADG
jgi:hypothetical protein